MEMLTPTLTAKITLPFPIYRNKCGVCTLPGYFRYSSSSSSSVPPAAFTPEPIPSAADTFDPTAAIVAVLLLQQRKLLMFPWSSGTVGEEVEVLSLFFLLSCQPICIHGSFRTTQQPKVARSVFLLSDWQS